MIAGIDFSTHAIDVVLLDEDTRKVRWHRAELEGPSSFDRARTVRDRLPSRGWWDDEGVIAIGIEEPAGQMVGHMFRIQGAILQCLPPATLVHPWMPSGWRKAVGLKGNCTKEIVATAARIMLRSDLDVDLDEWPQDAFDAYCLARATAGAIEVTT